MILHEMYHAKGFAYIKLQRIQKMKMVPSTAISTFSMITHRIEPLPGDEIWETGVEIGFLQLDDCGLLNYAVLTLYDMQSAFIKVRVSGKEKWVELPKNRVHTLCWKNIKKPNERCRLAIKWRSFENKLPI